MHNRTDRNLLPYHRSLIESCHDCLFVIDPSGRITDVNAAAEHITGLSQKELADTDFAGYFTDPDKASAFLKELFAKNSLDEQCMAVRHKNDSFTEVMLCGRVFLDELNSPAGALLTGRPLALKKKGCTLCTFIVRSGSRPYYPGEPRRKDH